MHGTTRAPQTRNAGPREQAGRQDRYEPRGAGLRGLQGAARAEEGCTEGHRPASEPWKLETDSESSEMSPGLKPACSA